MWSVVRRVRARLNRTFYDRTLLIRDAKGTRSVVLSARLQKTAVASLGLLMGAAVVATGAAVWQQSALSQRTATLSEVRADYTSLRQKLTALKAKAESLTADAGPDDVVADDAGAQAADGPVSAVRENLTELARANRKLTRRIARVRAGVRGADARAEQLARQRDRLRAELANARSALADAVEQRDAAKRRLARLKRDVRAESIANRARRAAVRSARQRSREIKTRLSAAKRRVTTLRDEVGAVEEQLAASRARRQALLTTRTRLAEKVRRLESRVGIDSSENMSLIARVSDVAKALQQAEKRTRALASSRQKLRERVEDLQKRLAALRKRDAGLFKHLTAQTRNGLKRVKRTIKMTGLDVDRLVHRVQAQKEGARGGPLVHVGLNNSGPIAKHAGILSRKVRRMLALQKALGRMPLTAPVESYWISSYFGKRRDPYTNEWAMHEGLDLAADAGSAVKATAPGTVVYAGTKSGYGRMVKVDHGLGITTIYGHLKSLNVDDGTKIDHRGKLGELGNTGRSTGPHVHYEVRMDGEPMDPMQFLKAGKHVFKG